MKKKTKTNYKKDFFFKGGEVFERMSYLLNLSSTLYDQFPDSLSKVYAFMVKDIAKRNAMRIDNKFKKLICNLCNNLIFKDSKTKMEFKGIYFLKSFIIFRCFRKT